MVLPILGAAGAVAAATIAGDVINLYRNRDVALSQFSQDNIIFPSDLVRNASVPFMSMEFSSYKRRSIYEQPFYQQQMKIRLPIPENLTEQTSLSYQTEELSSTMGAALESLSEGNQGFGAGVRNVLGGAVIDTARSLPNLLGAIVGGRAGGLGGAVVGGVAAGQIQILNQAPAAISALTGITTNPFQVVLFKSPNFRRHSFSWKFIPTSLAESETLRSLIEIFKFYSLPGISSMGAIFFSYPEILQINFRPSDRYMYKFKPCVVEGITVNYAPNSPSFVKSSGAPTAIVMTINLHEIEIMTKADFLRDSSGVFGRSSPERTVRELNADRGRRLGTLRGSARRIEGFNE